MTMLDVKPPAWMEYADCAQVDPALFFPKQGGNKNAVAAIAICETCPVIQRCRDWALAIEKTDGVMPGVYGGLSTSARRKLHGGPQCRRDECDNLIVGMGYTLCADHSKVRAV